MEDVNNFKYLLLMILNFKYILGVQMMMYVAESKKKLETSFNFILISVVRFICEQS